MEMTINGTSIECPFDISIAEESLVCKNLVGDHWEYKIIDYYTDRSIKFSTKESIDHLIYPRNNIVTIHGINVFDKKQSLSLLCHIQYLTHMSTNGN